MRRTVLKEGEEVEAKFMGVDRKARTVILSVKAKEYQEEVDVMQDYSNTGSATMSLGDLIKEQMENKDD